MGYSYKVPGAGDFPHGMTEVNGIITTDATAQPTMTVTAAAGAYNNLTCNSNVGFRQNDVIQINGADTAGGNLATIMSQIGQQNTTADPTRFCIRQQRPVVTAVADVPTSPYYKVWTRFRPDYVRLLNLATQEQWEWWREMAENTAIKTTAAGVRTIAADTGIWPMMFGFHFHPSFLGISQSAVFDVRFSSC